MSPVYTEGWFTPGVFAELNNQRGQAPLPNLRGFLVVLLINAAFTRPALYSQLHDRRARP